MKEFDSLKVMYHDRLVGRLTMGTNDTCLFQYEKEWLDSGFSISPLKLPLRLLNIDKRELANSLSKE
ncbi:HipA N-terminal domain-containing protein [Segatella buccae]|uniref:Toxin-antitoxin system, toxin component, HipA family n=1 Tax=Segatella buccae ATCC 33574 TaxID=873513 RepID=E6KAK2_9BACT|nr:HipA N-terminal domain-containing protein [Segatella buccae]EFU29426.1 toxin-antitoxin system, toxin component, HipA family [Segatella buccae ATCC 33574]